MLEKKIVLLGAILPVYGNIQTCFPAFAIIVFIKEHPKLQYLFAASIGNND